jgi:hypothetical protein
MKNFKQMTFSQKTFSHGTARFFYKGDLISAIGEEMQIDSFNLSRFSFSDFSFGVVNYGAVQNVYPQLEKTAYFSWEVRNGEAGEDLFLTDVKLIYFTQN